MGGGFSEGTKGSILTSQPASQDSGYSPLGVLRLTEGTALRGGGTIMPHDQLVVSINFVEFRYAEIARNKFVRGVVSWERFLDAEDQCHNTPRAGYAIRTGSVRYSKYCIAPFRTVALSSQCTLRGRSLVSVTGTSSYSPRDIRTLTTALLYLMKILHLVTPETCPGPVT